jgi:hypothetical protein
VFTSGTYAQTFNTLDLSFYNPDFVTAIGGTAADTEAALAQGKARYSPPLPSQKSGVREWGQSIAAVMQERGDRYRERMAGISEKVAGHLESLEANEILLRSSQVEKIDTVARRTFGLDNTASGNGAVNVDVLCGGRAIVQVNQKNE